MIRLTSEQDMLRLRMPSRKRGRERRKVNFSIAAEWPECRHTYYVDVRVREFLDVSRLLLHLNGRDTFRGEMKALGQFPRRSRLPDLCSDLRLPLPPSRGLAGTWSRCRRAPRAPRIPLLEHKTSVPRTTYILCPYSGSGIIQEPSYFLEPVRNKPHENSMTTGARHNRRKTITYLSLAEHPQSSPAAAGPNWP